MYKNLGTSELATKIQINVSPVRVVPDVERKD